MAKKEFIKLAAAKIVQNEMRKQANIKAKLIKMLGGKKMPIRAKLLKMLGAQPMMSNADKMLSGADKMIKRNPLIVGMLMGLGAYGGLGRLSDRTSIGNDSIGKLK